MLLNRGGRGGGREVTEEEKVNRREKMLAECQEVKHGPRGIVLSLASIARFDSSADRESI